MPEVLLNRYSGDERIATQRCFTGDIKAGIKKWFFSFIICFAFIQFSCNSDVPLFSELKADETHINFNNKVTEHDSLNIFDYLYFYNGGGVATGDINNDGLPDIFFTANSKGANKLYLNKGNMQFEDITAKAGVAGISDWCSGVTMADVNGDGLLDIYVCSVSKKLGLEGHNALYINNGNLTFSERSSEYGLDFSGYSTQAVFFDYDHDGDLDCYLLNQSDHPNQMYGDTSLRRKTNAFAGDRLFRNDCNASAKKYTDVTIQAGIYSGEIGYGLGIAVADLNDDGWEDIYVGNDFQENDYYYINNHDGTFKESGARHFSHYSRFSMGNDIADFNNDGEPDIFTADMLPLDEKVLKSYGSDEQPDIYNYKIVQNGYQYQYSRNCLQKNMGNGIHFSDVALMDGVSATDWSWSPLFADFDNDGIKDLFISNGIGRRMSDLDYIKFISSQQVQQTITKTKQFDSVILKKVPSGKVEDYIFKGSSDEHFINMNKQWGISTPTFSTGSSCADLDNDGDLDLVVNNLNGEAIIYKNNLKKNNFLNIACKGKGFNTYGIGAKVYLFNKGKLQYQQLMLTRGFQSSVEPRLHFGLDTSKHIDSLMVIWPDASFQVVKEVKANQQILLQQTNAAGIFNFENLKHITPVENITDSIAVHWKHKENDFFDFNQQYLIPHQLSAEGPKMAVADINGDGLDDFYVCGAKYQPGSLFIQNKSGKFTEADTNLFEADALCEDVDAIFFDADNDGDKDLYVASGGNELKGNNAALEDRLYINDGKGNFKKSENAVPSLFVNKSVVSAADIDHDGDEDLFVGVRADATAYGVPQNSYLLLNNGEGKFSVAGNKVINLQSIGMVSAAVFADLNNDGWTDLAVTGEWMPLKIFINNQGKFEEQKNTLPSGMWQSLYIMDIDKDGNSDIIAGNFGLNSKLHASENAPLKLYVKDIDGNGIMDQLLTYTKDKKEYTFLGKDELEKQLPGMRKKFLGYTDFAGKTVQEVFGDQLNNALKLQIQTLQSMVFKNNGRAGFTLQALPSVMQYSPVFAFLSADIEHNGSADLISGGNFFGVLPYEGRYDAMPLALCINDGKGNLKQTAYLPQSFLKITGEVRDMKSLHCANKTTMIAVARNNDSLLFFRY